MSMSQLQAISELDKSTSDPVFSCFICTTHFPGRFMRLVKTTRSAQDEEYFPFLSIQWTTRSMGESQPAPVNEVPCCVFCCKDLHEQWVMHSKRDTPIELRHYQTRRKIHQLLKDNSGVCFLCGSISRLSTMYRLSTSYYPFLSNYPLPYGASDTDEKGRVVTCEPCRSTLYTQWKQFETENIMEPNRVYRIQVGANEVRVSATSLTPRARKVDQNERELPQVSVTHRTGVVHAHQVLAKDTVVLHTQTGMSSAAHLKRYERKSGCSPSPVMPSANGVQKISSVTSARTTPLPHSSNADRNQPSIVKSQISVSIPSSLVGRLPVTSYPTSKSHPPVSGAGHMATVKILPHSDNSSDSKATATVVKADSAKAACYLCGTYTSVNLLSLVSTVSGRADVTVSFYPFLQKLAPAGAARRDGLGRAYVCIDCHANLTVLERIHTIRSGDNPWESLLHQVSCYRCGSKPGKDGLSYLSCRLTKSEIPYFPSLWNAPRAQGSRPVDKAGRILVCHHCRDECYVKFYEYRRQNVNVEARNYLPSFACYVCNSHYPGKAMHWIPSFPNEALGHQDCYPFILNLKAGSGTATLNRDSCALVCTACKDLLFTQFLTMEQARVPLRFRSYMVNGRVFQPPTDIPKAIASQATFLNVSAPTSSQTTTTSNSSSTITSKLVENPVSQVPPPTTIISTSIVSTPIVPGSSGKKDLAIQHILNSQPKLAPKPVSGDLELLGPCVGTMLNHQESGVKSGLAAMPSHKQYVLQVSVPDQNGVSSSHATVVSTQSRPLLHTSSNNQVIVTEQDKQKRLLEQQQKFRSQVDKLQRIWSQRSHGQQSDALPKKETLSVADQKTTKSLEPGCVKDDTLESWKQDKDIALVKTQNHAKAVAKHSEEKLVFFRKLGLLATEEIEHAVKDSVSVIVNYPFIEEPIPVDSGDEDNMHGTRMTRNRLRLIENQHYSDDEMESSSSVRIKPVPNYQALLQTQSSGQAVVHGDDIDSTLPPAKWLYRGNHEMNEKHRKRKLIEELTSNQRARSIRRKTTDYVQSVSGDVCCICSRDGEVIFCDGCNKTFHLQCLDQPLNSMPVGLWLCPSCAEWTCLGPDPEIARWPGIPSIVRSFFTLSAERDAESKWLRGNITFFEGEQTKLAKEMEWLTTRVMDLISCKTEASKRKSELESDYCQLNNTLEQLRKL